MPLWNFFNKPGTYELKVLSVYSRIITPNVMHTHPISLHNFSPNIIQERSRELIQEIIDSLFII